jgi:hypothetical protein
MRLPNPDFGTISFGRGYPEAMEPRWLGWKFALLGSEHISGEDTLQVAKTSSNTSFMWFVYSDIVIFNIHMYDIYIYIHIHTHTYTNMILLFETWAKPKIMFYPPQQPRTSFLNAFSGCVLCATCVRKSYWWHHMNEGYTVCRLDQYVSFGLCIHRLAWNRCGTPYGSTQ